MEPVLAAAWILPRDAPVQADYAHSVGTCRLVSDPALVQDHALVVLGPCLPPSGWGLRRLAAVVQVHP